MNNSTNYKFPSTSRLPESGELDRRITKLEVLQNPCRICPRNCLVSREENDLGICQASLQLKISSTFAHFGEEPELVGYYGSGTIFLSFCNLRCFFCQNYEISHFNEGRLISLQNMATIMLHLQEQGCHNINFVTPTHFIPQIVESIAIAQKNGLKIPLVYNCGGYESPETLQLLDGIFDIYMPDFKFATKKSGDRYIKAPDYFEVACAAIKEMYRQVGNLTVDKNGIAKSGLLIRHLIMPELKNESKIILEFIARNLSTDSYVNIMAQYHPCHLAFQFPELNRRITNSELHEVKNYAEELGLHLVLTK